MSEHSAFGASSAAEHDEDELPPLHARMLPAPASPATPARAPVQPAPSSPVSDPVRADPPAVTAPLPAMPSDPPRARPVTAAPAPGAGGHVPAQRSAPEPATAPVPLPDTAALLPGGASPAPAPLPGGASPAPAPAPFPEGVAPAANGTARATANPYVTAAARPSLGQGGPTGDSADPRRGFLRRRGSRMTGPEQQRLARLQAPVSRPYRISVSSIKGGVGKTTTSAMLGLTFARYRADRTVVIDANPHAGTLADRLLGERIMPTVRDLVTADRRRREAGGPGLTDPLQIHQYLGRADRLMVAASEQNPDISELFGEEQYRATLDVLTRAFEIVVTDSGTGMKHSAMKGTLAATDRLVVVAAPRFDAARRAAKTLDEVYAQGYPELVRDAVVVITMDAPKATGINMHTLEDYFRQLCGNVVRIPYDPHLYVGGTIHYDQVAPATRGAYMDLAALLADGFGGAGPAPGPAVR